MGQSSPLTSPITLFTVCAAASALALGNAPGTLQSRMDSSSAR